MADVRRLPVAISETWEWQLRATCRNLDCALFFHPERERGSLRAEREARAKRICHTCPVITECGLHALRVDEPYGVWGGMSVAERRDLLGRRESGVS
jgi:WhiB family redox-sensing transcriptional regulator